ncbi:hypothetical protein Nmel_013157 [Mimus melanotis]
MESPWVKYPSPKDYSPPVYLFLRDFVQPKYPSPAALERDRVMQIVKVLNRDLLALYGMRHLAQMQFQPVQFRVFEDNWRHMTEKAAAENMEWPQADPRYAVGSDALMGQHHFSSPDL